MNILDKIPPAAREWIYGILGLAFTVESTLDAFGAGVVEPRPQGIAIALCSALGFGLAFRHVGSGDPLPPPPPPQ